MSFGANDILEPIGSSYYSICCYLYCSYFLSLHVSSEIYHSGFFIFSFGTFVMWSSILSSF